METPVAVPLDMCDRCSGSTKRMQRRAAASDLVPANDPDDGSLEWLDRQEARSNDRYARHNESPPQRRVD